MAAGVETLADVKAEKFDGESEKVMHYFAAVYAATSAVLVERYRNYSASGTKKPGESEVAAGEYWRDARFSISRIGDKPGCIVGLL